VTHIRLESAVSFGRVATFNTLRVLFNGVAGGAVVLDKVFGGFERSNGPLLISTYPAHYLYLGLYFLIYSE